eukprot:gnl/TRDRNA2_/TRDRNA2_120301_c0_seq1.p1 gnl/TRDRNA2_/TRDRNA2_120301_c0~~gnl/TRDRNA2_/TRDRNA2_120301_c0_seq1.p1  ORF type:complete len:122 (-),score=10.03 gnl/TRDRNA2_/TRDRNA2_120301_c0_seq1:20-385(-)
MDGIASTNLVWTVVFMMARRMEQRTVKEQEEGEAASRSGNRTGGTCTRKDTGPGGGSKTRRTPCASGTVASAHHNPKGRRAEIMFLYPNSVLFRSSRVNAGSMWGHFDRVGCSTSFWRVNS